MQEFKHFFVIVCVALLASCANDINFEMPLGPQGVQGEKGEAGLSAFELWKIVYKKDPNVPIEDFFESLRGPAGKDGATPTVTIGSNGNWIINGVDTGVPARGKDGQDGKDGVTPTVTIGSNGNWVINGVDTGVPAKGKDGQDGKDGITPTVTIGSNGNWIINGVDTGVPAKGKDGQDGQDGKSPEVTIGTNGNWFINGVDTGKPSRGDNGADGNNGKSAYELWKEAVDKGEMTNKDGTPYTGGNTWQDFFKWLQGGDVSVLHQYWITLPGNEGKTIEQFIRELFDCHCEQIQVSLTYNNSCVELKPDGTPISYTAKLIVNGQKDTKMTVTVGTTTVLNNYTFTKDNEQKEVSIPQTTENQTITILYTLSGDTQTKTKTLTLPALHYLQGVSVNTETVSDSQVKVTVNVNDPSKVKTLTIDGIDIVATPTGWDVSADKKTYTKLFDRASTAQQKTLTASDGVRDCSIIPFTIVALPQVTINGNPQVTVAGDCDITLTITGTEGMVVKAKPSFTGGTEVTLPEISSGTYVITFPRKYDSYNILVSAEKAGYGTYTNTVNVAGNNLLPVPLQMTDVVGGNKNATYARTFKNLTTQPLTIKFSRGVNNVSGAHERAPWIQGNVTEYTIPANGSIDITFNKDYTNTMQAGRYVVTVATTNVCNENKSFTFNVANQENYSYGFRLVGGSNGTDVTVALTITDALPNAYVQLLLMSADGLLKGVVKTQLNASGNTNGEILFTMSKADYNAAVANGKGRFVFSVDAEATQQLMTSNNIDFKPAP